MVPNGAPRLQRLRGAEGLPEGLLPGGGGAGQGAEREHRAEGCGCLGEMEEMVI